MTSLSTIAYVTDLEGQWERLAGFVARTPGLELQGETLTLADGHALVFGGDAIDRGPWSRRILRTLLSAKERYGARVVLLAGNRDLNKLRLVRELAGFPPSRAPLEIQGNPPALLRFIFAQTMGAAGAFEHRATELAAEGRASDDASVVASFLDDLAPGGLLSRYLAACQLAFRHAETLFLHGGVSDESLGHVPGRSRVSGVDAWIEALNAFCREQIASFLARAPSDLARPPWAPIVTYQAPAPGRPTNPASVVYGRLSDTWNNPALPSPAVVKTLENEGVQRLVLGHTPSGDIPAILRAERFELVIADNSRGHVPTGSSVRIEGSVLTASGRVVLDGGAEVEVETRRTLGEATQIGLRTKDERLVTARATDGRLVLYRGLPGHVIEHRAVDADALAELEEPWPR